MLGALLYFGVASIGAASRSARPVASPACSRRSPAALIVPNGLGILRRAAGERPGCTSVSVVDVRCGRDAGPLVGGLFTAIDWRLVFLFKVPVVALASSSRDRPSRGTRATGDEFDVMVSCSWACMLIGAARPRASAAKERMESRRRRVRGPHRCGAVRRYELAQPDAALPPRCSASGRSRRRTGRSYSRAFPVSRRVRGPALLAADPSSTVLVGVALTALSAAMVVLGPATGSLVDDTARAGRQPLEECSSSPGASSRAP